jgi:hypothetical protein
MSVTKSVPQDIHDLAGVPPDKNPDIYQMTVQMIGAVVDHCEKAGLSLEESKRVMGKRKDELIRELISLRDQGVLIGESDKPRREKPVRHFKMRDVHKVDIR